MSNPNQDKIKASVHTILENLGLDTTQEGLVKTPERVAKSFEFLTSGYKKDAKAIMEKAMFTVSYQDMVIVRDVEIYSLCEHHLLPFYGRCHVGYIPKDKVVGLSKIPRVVEVYARRLQVQERLTHEISESFFKNLGAQGVGVVIEAYHLCMMMRGVEKQSSYTVTSSMQGVFRNLETREEFLSLIHSPKRTIL
jgi:GTP cyclohydrolase IA